MLINMERAIQLLNAGEVVAFPTETVYGLGARIDNESALQKIFTTKARPLFDPLIVHVASLSGAKSLAKEWPKAYDVLAQAFWPGPLTLICDKVASVSPLITSGLDTVGIRWPKHPMANELLAKIGVGLAAPSANKFGRTSPTTAAHVESEFEGRVAVLDGGACEVGLESTVVRADFQNNRWQIQIFRPGGVSAEAIGQALTQAGLNHEISRVESVASPGHLKAHYQPALPVIQVMGEWRETRKQEALTALGLKDQNLIPAKLTLGNDPLLAARKLYAQLRALSETDGRFIVIEHLPEQKGHLWDAIWDRVDRAASARI